MKYLWIIILGTGVLVILFFALSFGFRATEKKIPLSPLERIPPPGMSEYKNILFRFSILYPEDLRVREYLGGSDTTIVFESTQGGKGFQIFIVPYASEQISEEQFKKDLPSGIVKDPADILIDGTKAVMFLSKNAMIGDTREVWFIKNGFLFEVVTYRDLDAWLSSIMQTWQWLNF